MFLEIITQPRREYELVEDETGLQSNPPAGLVAAVSWETDNADEVAMLMVWATPEARGNFGFEKIMPLAQQGKVTSNPKRLKPVRIFVRQAG
jgi:hypothetical protein